MHMTITTLLTVCLAFVAGVYSSDSSHLDELRIHEGAERGSRLTASYELKRKMDKVINCFGTLDSDVPWIEYRENRNEFFTLESLVRVNVARLQHENLNGTLHMLCPGGKVHHLPFKVHVTRTNRHSPSFSQQSYEVFVPLDTPVGGSIAMLDVTDHDAVIYNSQRSLSFKKTPEPNLFNIFNDGQMTLKASIDATSVYKRIHTTVVAVDYGSPQLYSEVNVTIIPVTVSQVRNLRVNVASSRYQIFEWEHPEYGVADKYRLLIQKNDRLLADVQVDAHTTQALTRVKIGPGWDVLYSVAAVTVLGETRSEQLPFTLLHNKLECVGVCSDGGLPLCFYGLLNTPQQFEDSNGKHCQCYPGYTGVSCEMKEYCAAEKKVDSYGGLDWPETVVNSSSRLFCPYNPEQVELWRRCEWNAMEERAEWSDVKNTEKCQSQASVLTHLGMLATFAGRADQVSTINTVNTFITKLLAVPSFASTGPAHFDQRIAEHMVQVLDALLRVNYTNIRGNATEVKGQLLSRIETLGFRLPIPFHLHSKDDALAFNVISWQSGNENFRSMVGRSCFVQLPTINEDHVLRATCMANASLVDTIDSKNPVLSLKVDLPNGLSFNKITLGLKPSNSSENYTCVYYDEIERGWSTRGVKKVEISPDGFVVCEASHLSSFSILPESVFSSSQSLWRDFALLFPTVTSFIAIVCAVFLLFLAAIQRGPSVDYPLLLFLFLVFCIHSMHLVMLIAPQIGDPFLFSPSLHLAFQFCTISVCALSALLSNSIHGTVMSYRSNEKPDPPLCSSFCNTVLFGIVIPAVLTVTTYLFASQNRHELSRVLSRVDWLFLANYLLPCVLFCAVCTAISISSLKAASHSSSRPLVASSLSLSPATHSSSTLLLLLSLLISHIVLFVFRSTGDAWIPFAFSLIQLSYCVVSFLFAGYVFRLRYMQVNGDDVSTRSLERKRDISRALLAHVDTRGSEADSLGSALIHTQSDPLTTSFHPPHHTSSARDLIHSSNGTVVVRPIGPTPSPPLTLDSPTSFPMSASLFERTPMVSIV